jgi:hypothetical protein
VKLEPQNLADRQAENYPSHRKNNLVKAYISLGAGKKNN